MKIIFKSRLVTSFLTCFSFILFFKAHAQLGISHEVGIIAGPAFFQTDYGQRGDLSTFINNNGVGVGIIHYLNFAYRADCSCFNRYSYFNDHFKVRSEFTYYKGDNFRHEGKWVDPSRTSVTANQLRGMRGSTSVTSLGMQLEYFPLSIRDFMVSNGGGFAPYVALGAHFNTYSPRAFSTIGVLGIPETTPDKYLTAFTNEGGNTFSILGSLGTRYKLTKMSDLLFDLRWQYFNSNWVDGLNPDPVLYPENKANDWLFFVNIGFVVYL